VNIDPEIARDRLRPGVEVILNEALNVVEALDQEIQGEVVRVKEMLADDRMIAVGRGDEERVALMSARVKEAGIRAGDPVLLDGRSGDALEKLPRQAVEVVIVAAVSNITYVQIGGLGGSSEDRRHYVER